MSDKQVDLKVDTLGIGDSLDKAAETTQLDDRYSGRTIGGGISPPYPPDRLAALQELNGTHAIAIGKKASREVGFGFDLVPHPRADDPSEEELERAENFWYGRDTIWRIGPQGTTSGSPTEVFELARRDWHGVGWLALELIYSDDDQLRGMAHVPAVEVRVRKAETSDGSVTRGHGYLQEEDGDLRYYGEAGDRTADDPTYIDRVTGDQADSLEAIDNKPANEILFIPNPSPLSKYYGIPDWIAEVQTMVGDQEAKRFNREFFEWDALGQYFIVVEGGTLSEGSREDVRELIKGLRQEDGRRVAVLEADELVDQGIVNPDSESTPTIRIEQLQQHGDEDMSFTAYRQMNEHEIAKVHQVPPQLIGRMESANRSNSKESVRDFVKEVIEPRQSRFAERLYRVIHQKILDIEDWMPDFETRGAENEREEAEILATKLQAGGQSLTINEVRDLLGEEAIDELEGVLVGDAFDAAVQTLPREFRE